MTPHNRDHSFLLFLLIASALLVGAVIWPLAGSLFLAIVLAVVLWPLQVKLTARLKGRRQLSASLFTFGLVVVVLVPLLALSAVVVSEGSEGVAFVSDTVRSEGVRGLLDHLPPKLRELAESSLAQLPEKQSLSLEQTVQDQMSAGGSKAAAAVGSALTAAGALLFESAMMLIAFFFLLVQGDQAIDWIESVSPLRSKQTRELLVEFKSVSYALVVSTIVTCAVQAIAALAGYLIARVPHPVFFAGLTFFVAFIPAVGAGSVCLFAALLLLLTDHGYAALFLALWALLVVALVDNLVKPFLIQHEIAMPGAVVFFSLMGGLAAFGGVGLLLGPLATAFFITLVRMYRRETGHHAGQHGGDRVAR